MPFLMGDEKGIDIDARLRLSMPSGTPADLVKSDTTLVEPNPMILAILIDQL